MMPRTKHVTATLACALVAAGWWFGGGPIVAARSVDPVVAYDKDFLFLEKVAENDALWEPVLREKVIMKRTSRTLSPVQHVDRYTTRAKPEANVTTHVDPFHELLELFHMNVMVGTHVAFVAVAVRNALVCTVLKHVSMQALVLHWLIAADPAAVAVASVIRWLEHMVRQAADKLVAFGQRVPAVARTHEHVLKLMLPHADITGNALHTLAEEMYADMEKCCVAPANGHSHYNTVVRELKRKRTLEDLNYLHGQLVDENVKGLEDLDSIEQIVKYSGELMLEDNIMPEGFANLGPEELRKVAIINRIQMNYLMLNLPIKAMAEPQWSNLFKLKTLNAEIET